ncbi:hypothetical protein F3K40_23145 [Streptomyces sp. LBUM 1478]|uniref:DUF6238 family protein n=7 Tax=Streptomyces TaxID=1883 RepID=A0ABW9I9E0_STRGJ|nr:MULTISPECIES: DUF6238 family protein [Streptomyces]MBP5861428.1 hypothetical protein [Streptomyces sp. LBUM 1484]MBP5869639.1 hypothetical protein [Streptomyces sp. LBUM 1485]MBP5908052.1 hypothetical protein [Streptomyces sp. LBUM 1478]MBP5928969.1 hypothetical protein [Streptomyces sp. LBUM 1479]KFG02920.1 hypothetical protein IQ61_43945 [Streptomyces scabiei]
MPQPRTTELDAHPYLRAASTGVRHHTRALARSAPPSPAPVDRVHLDVVHAHLTALHHLLDHLADLARPPHPAAGRHLATARTRLFQAAAGVHDAFHLLPVADETPTNTGCHPERLSEGPPVLTICQRHLAAGHVVRRKTTPSDLNTPLHGHTTTCSQ